MPVTPSPTYTLDDLLAIMARLRDPGMGCPWDRQQTFHTIAPYTIEEAYEVVDAIEQGNLEHLQEELGDLLYQVVYHARMAEEQGRFDFAGVVQALAEKLVRRHPHLFAQSEATVTTSEGAFSVWQAMKAKEKVRSSLLDGIAGNLPALVIAQKLQARAARVNFDWPDVRPVLAKIREELDEIEQALFDGDKEGVRDEVGDFLFAAVNLARHLEVDAEQSVRQCNNKFRRRFAYIEQEIASQGKNITECSLAELDRLWDEAKLAGY